jgi:hypothetical protein
MQTVPTGKSLTKSPYKETGSQLRLKFEKGADSDRVPTDAGFIIFRVSTFPIACIPIPRFCLPASRYFEYFLVFAFSPRLRLNVHIQVPKIGPDRQVAFR